MQATRVTVGGSHLCRIRSAALTLTLALTQDASPIVALAKLRVKTVRDVFSIVDPGREHSDKYFR